MGVGRVGVFFEIFVGSLCIGGCLIRRFFFWVKEEREEEMGRRKFILRIFVLFIGIEFSRRENFRDFEI